MNGKLGSCVGHLRYFFVKTVVSSSPLFRFNQILFKFVMFVVSLSVRLHFFTAVCFAKNAFSPAAAEEEDLDGSTIEEEVWPPLLLQEFEEENN